ISSSSFTWIASESRFCVFWMRNTIRKVTMVVPVLMTSCQVSLKPKIGPVMAQMAITSTARVKVSGRPVALAVHLAKRVNHDFDLVGLMCRLSEQFGCPPGLDRFALLLCAAGFSASTHGELGGEAAQRLDHGVAHQAVEHALA